MAVNYEIFPTKPKNGLILLEKASEEAIIKTLKIDSILFCTIIPEDTNVFQYIEKTQTDTTDQHRDYIYKKARKNTQRIEKIKWIKIIQRFKQQKKYTLGTPKNADIRLGWRSNNIFLVKPRFTFGLRKVPPGHVDIIETTEAPLLIYTPKRCARKTVYEHTREGILPYLIEKSFNTYELKPFHKYLAHSQLAYVLISVQKSLFSLTRMSAPNYNRLRLRDVYSIETFPFSERHLNRQHHHHSKNSLPHLKPTKWDTESEDHQSMMMAESSAADPLWDPNQSSAADSLWDPNQSVTADSLWDPNQSLAADPLWDPNQSSAAAAADPLWDPNQSVTADPLWDPNQSVTADSTAEPMIDLQFSPNHQQPSSYVLSVSGTEMKTTVFLEESCEDREIDPTEINAFFDNFFNNDFRLET